MSGWSQELLHKLSKAEAERDALAERVRVLEDALRFAVEGCEEIRELEEPAAEVAHVAGSVAFAIIEKSRAVLAAAATPEEGP